MIRFLALAILGPPAVLVAAVVVTMLGLVGLSVLAALVPAAIAALLRGLIAAIMWLVSP